MHLEWLGDDQPTIFADTSRVFNEFDLQSLINYCIALKEVPQGCIGPLGGSIANGAQKISIVVCSIPLVPHQELHGCVCVCVSDLQ